MTETAPHPTDRSTASAFALLADGVPLSLLLDLASAVPSRELFRDEPGDTGWLDARVA